MAGHSKWANIKHKKAAADAKRGKIFSKIAREITVSARIGGGDPGSNITLRTLLSKARAQNMPADNIDRAIKKGTGELDDGIVLDEITYEGYAPGGVAVVVMVLTDNKNRSASEVRHAFTKADASLSGQGSVTRSFQRKGVINVPADSIGEDALMEAILEAGAEDLEQAGDVYNVTTEPNEMPTVVEALQAAGVTVSDSNTPLVPDSMMEISDAGQARKIITLVETLENLDDVQDVYTNLDVSDAVLAELEAG